MRPFPIRTAAVPLVRRNLFANKPRLVRSVGGIAFAVLLMIVELGFRNAFIDSMLLGIRQLDADLVLISKAKYQFDRNAPFPRRQLYRARAVAGVASARPLYAERTASLWKNPQTHKLYVVQVFAFDPDEPVFLIPEVTARLSELRQPDTIMIDRRARGFIGGGGTGTMTELAHRRVQIVGTFSLGPNFFADGTILMSDRNYLDLFGKVAGGEVLLPDIELGVVKTLPGYDVAEVQNALRKATPDSVSVLTKAELIEREAGFHARVSPVGPIFGVGVLVGFAVGMMIAYQILYSDLFDQLPQYATMKAIGYRDRSLIKIVLQQAIFYALLGYVPAWILCVLIFRILSQIVLLPMQATPGLTATSFVLTIVMCVAAALIAVRRVIAVDPAEIF